MYIYIIKSVRIDSIDLFAVAINIRMLINSVILKKMILKKRFIRCL